MEKNRGLLAGLGAFTLWGLLPLYWKALSTAIPLEILCHRIVWSTLVTLLLLIFWNRAGSLRKALQEKKVFLAFLLTSLLLSVNWLIYIWAVNSNYIVESSLGYYINPLVNVMLGVLFLKERLRPPQWAAILLAAAGVSYLTFVYGHFPWIAIMLALTFGLYGLLRKIAPLPSLEGLCMETTILCLPALLVLFYLGSQGDLAFTRQEGNIRLLFMAAGVVTSLPLILFGYAAQNLPLSTLGIIQYLAPTLQLCIGIFIYNESFPQEQMIGFTLVWSALAIYGLEGMMRQLGRKKARLNA